MKVRQAVKEALTLLTRRDRRLLGLSIAIQMATSLLDLAGVVLLGLVGALAVATVQSQPPPPFILQFADAVGLADVSSQGLVAIFAAAAGILLLGKSLISSILTRRVFVFLANRQALVAARLTRELLSRPLTFIQLRSSQESAYALIQGASSATLTLLGQLVIFVTECTLLVVLGVALLFLDPAITIASILFFGFVGVLLQRVMGHWSSQLGARMATADILSLNAVQEALGAYREVSVANRREMYATRIKDLRWESSRVAADRLFIQQFPKYVFEAALVAGGLVLAGFLFLTMDSVAAVGTLALFLVAATRVLPSLLRLQGASLTLRDAAGASQVTFELARDLGNTTNDQSPLSTSPTLGFTDFVHPGFRSSLSLRDVSFSYPGVSEDAVRDVSLEVDPGTSIAILGRSGAGKSTIADLALGILEPRKGTVEISGVVVSEAVKRWPGALAYVPQEIFLANGTVRDNVALGLPRGAIDDGRVWEALEKAHLEELFRSSGNGLDTELGEGALKLSGGQKQRLGIARALYTKPRLLVLDEATSALDAETETAITEIIAEMEGTVTTLIVAHRLSTVRHADMVVYLDRGSVLAVGSFASVRERVPDLEKQAQLMGLGGPK